MIATIVVLVMLVQCIVAFAHTYYVLQYDDLLCTLPCCLPLTDLH